MFDERWMRAGSKSILTVAASIAIVPVGASAAPDTSEWKCERCPFASGARGELAAGTTYVSDDAATIGDATGYDEQGGYLNVDGDGLLAGGAHRVRWRLEDLGLDSRVITIDGTYTGAFDYGLAFSQLPRHRFETTRTIFMRTADNLLALPSSWTFAPTTAGLVDLGSSLVAKDIESERETLAIGAGYRPASKFQLFANYQRQEQDGTHVVGGSYFTNSSLLPRQTDRRTEQLDAGIRYDGGRGSVQLAYFGSFFNDRLDATRWESPFVTQPGAEQGALSEAPDNEFQQLTLTGSYRLPWLDTRIALSAALGRGTQDDALLPYTTNANLAVAPLPASTADAEIDTTDLALTVVSTPLAGARVKFAIRYDERDNQTARLPWSRVIADTFVSGETELNTPYGFERLRMNLSGEYRVSGNLTVAGGYDYTETERAFQEVADQSEDTGWGRIRWRPNAFLDIAARAGVSRREADFYDIALAAGMGQNPLLRKFNLAYRYRQFAELSASVSPPDWPVALGARASFADDSYSSSTVGLTGSDELRVAADVSWPVSDKASVYFSGGLDRVDTEQTGSAAFAVPDWQARQSDKYYNLGAGFRMTGIGEKVDLQLDYVRASGRTEINVVGGGGPEAFPDLRSTLDSLRLRAVYHWSETIEAGLFLRYEKFPTEDWALEGVAADTIPTVLTLGAAPYDDEVWMAGISFRYMLGGQ